MRPLLIAFAALSVACSSGSPSPGTSKPPSTDPARALASLSTTEATTYCREALAYQSGRLSAEQTHRASCAFMGIMGSVGATTDSEAQGKCKSSYDACLAAPAEGGGDGGEDPCQGFATKTSSCGTLTVAEMNACQEEQITLLAKYAEPGLCSSITLHTPETTIETPKCDVVQAKCPALLE